MCMCVCVCLHRYISLLLVVVKMIDKDLELSFYLTFFVCKRNITNEDEGSLIIVWNFRFYDLSSLWTFIGQCNHVIDYKTITLASLTMIKEDWMHMYSGCSIRDFRQLLSNLHQYLWQLTHEQENTQLQILVCHH